MRKDVILSSSPDYMIAKIILVLFFLFLIGMVCFHFFFLFKISRKVNENGKLLDQLLNQEHHRQELKNQKK